MTTFKAKDKAFYKGREATVLELVSPNKAHIEFRLKGVIVTSIVRLSTLSKKPPLPSSPAQIKALLMLYEAEKAGREVVERRNQKRPMRPGTAGWLMHYKYVLYNHIGNLEFKYVLTDSGRKIASELAESEASDG